MLRLGALSAVLVGLVGAASPAWADGQGTPADSLVGGPSAEASAHVQVGGGLDVYFEHGVDMEAVRAPFTLHVGGLLQFDHVGYGDSPQALATAAGTPWHSDWDLRRARVRLEGTFLRAVHYRVRFNLDPGGQPGFEDLYLDWSQPYDESDGLWPRARLGQVKEPFGLEALTSSRWNTFMETAPPTQAFAPGRNPGLRLQSSPFDQHTTCWFGVFAPDAANLAQSDLGSGVAFTGRFTWLALNAPEPSRRLLSVGVGATLRYDIDEERFASNTGGKVGPRMIDTGVFPASETRIFQSELVFVHDRFSAQAEAFFAICSPDGSADVNYFGWYGQLSYFLTPPGRNFNRHTAVISRVEPARPVFGEGDTGWGAWEVASRYSFTDLSEVNVSGGTAHQFTFGLNWYPTAWKRITLNYTLDVVNDAYGDPSADGTLHLFGIRFQVDF